MADAKTIKVTLVRQPDRAAPSASAQTLRGLGLTRRRQDGRSCATTPPTRGHDRARSRTWCAWRRETMDLSNLSPAAGSRRNAQAPRPRPGLRASARPSGRGHKGRGARSGGNTPPGLRGRPDAAAAPPAEARLPQPVPASSISVVNLGQPRSRFAAGAVVDARGAASRSGLVRARPAGQDPRRRASSTKALTVKAHAFSAVARKARIAAAGGSAEVIDRCSKVSRTRRASPSCAAGCCSRSRMLAVYRLGVAIPTPGHRRRGAGRRSSRRRSDTVLGLVNLFSGGALEQLLDLRARHHAVHQRVDHPAAADGRHPATSRRLSKEGEVGRRKITQYTRYGTVVLVARPELLHRIGLEQHPGARRRARSSPARAGASALMTMITLTAGTAFIMWLGEQITERGIGNGISLIIFAGIVAALPVARSTTTVAVRPRGRAVALRRCSVIVAVHGRRRRGHHLHRARPAPHPGAVRQARRRPAHVRRPELAPAAQGQHRRRDPADLRLVAPDLPGDHRAASSSTRGRRRLPSCSRPATWLYNLVYVGLIIFFCYFYTAVTFNPVDVADNMKKYGGFIPGIRPGQRTAEYIDRVLSRITLGGRALHRRRSASCRPSSSSSSTCRSTSAARRC